MANLPFELQRFGYPELAGGRLWEPDENLARTSRRKVSRASHRTRRAVQMDRRAVAEINKPRSGDAA